MGPKPANIDEYISTLPAKSRETLEAIRRMITAAVPEAAETISYGMPTFNYRGAYLIYFAAATSHCAIYGASAGTMRFPIGEPPPEALVKRLLAERIKTIEAGPVKGYAKKNHAGGKHD
ncbi:MAG: DUF1801 domain-containing protein [SAR202 cluster bacterium]|nr:DUF1801 domain-containing protein [SAR202 cluster bacterium]